MRLELTPDAVTLYTQSTQHVCLRIALAICVCAGVMQDGCGSNAI